MAKRNKKEIQLTLPSSHAHGGARKGAGRPKTSTRVSHQSRPELKRHTPNHITIKLEKGLPTLRSKEIFKLFRQAVAKARMRGLRIVHFALLSNHLHLIIETDHKVQLSCGMRSFSISLAKLINGRLERNGKVFFDRFHQHVLKTVAEVRNAISYVLSNRARHLKLKDKFDVYSSISLVVNESKDVVMLMREKLRRLLESPRGFLLRQGADVFT